MDDIPALQRYFLVLSEQEGKSHVIDILDTETPYGSVFSENIARFTPKTVPTDSPDFPAAFEEACRFFMLELFDDLSSANIQLSLLALERFARPFNTARWMSAEHRLSSIKNGAFSYVIREEDGSGAVVRNMATDHIISVDDVAKMEAKRALWTQKRHERMYQRNDPRISDISDWRLDL